METYSNRMETGRLKRAIEGRRQPGDYICKTCNANMGQRPDGVAPACCSACGGRHFSVHVASRPWPREDPEKLHQKHRAHIARMQRETERVK